MPYIGKQPATISAVSVDTDTGTFSGQVAAASLDISGNVDVDGVLETDGLSIASTVITASAADINLIDGITNGTVIASKAIITDANKDISGGRNITISGELDAATLDISGNADIDGTLEADAITVNGTALNTVIAGVTVANATLAATTTVTDSTANTNFPVVFHDESNALLDDTGALRYNPSTGELLVPKLTVAGVTTTADTVTMQAANAVVFEGATADAHETTLTITDPTADRTITLPNVSGTLPILAADSNTAITSTPAELNILDGATVVVGEINALDLGSTAVGTAIASKAVILDSNKDYTGIRNFTISGELDAGSLDISGDIDVDGTTNLDNTDIDGTLNVQGETTLQTHLNMGDDDKIKLGAGSDIEIYHDGTYSRIMESGGTALVLDTTSTDIRLTASNSEVMGKFIKDGAVELYHNNVKAFETVSGGAKVTGDLEVTDDIDLNSDGAKITFGGSSETIILEHVADTGLTLQGSGTNTNFSLLSFHTGDSTVPDLRLGKSSSNTVGTFNETANGESLGQIRFTGQDTSGNTREAAQITVVQSADSTSSTVPATMRFSTGGSERFRCDASGNLLVGTTSSDSAGQGARLKAGGRGDFTVSGGVCSIMRRNSSDGNIMSFFINANEIGTIASNSGANMIIGTGDTGLYFNAGSEAIHPWNIGSNSARDNAIDLGRSGDRFQTLFATTSSINTSDKNEKQDIEELTDAEKRVAVVAKSLLRKYRWKDAVAKKGDKARIHFGIMSQDLQDAFTAESLDASRYGMFCSDTWWEKEISVDAVVADEEKAIEAKDAYTYIDTKQEATEGYTEKTRLGVRYSELLAFIISAI